MSTTPRRDTAATYRSLFRLGQFRVLLAGLLLFGIGFQVEILGLSVLIYSRTRSPLLTALTFGIGFLPQMIGGAVLTSLADRLPPRRAITVGLLARCAPGLIIGLAPALPIWAMLAVVAVAATCAPLVTGATSGLLPELLSGERYVLARSLVGFIMSGTQLLGLALGGAVLAVVPARHLLLVAGAALAGAAVLTRLGLANHPPRAATGRVGSGTRHAIADVVGSTLQGNITLLRDTRIRGLLLTFWLPSWLLTGTESLIVPYVGASGLPAGTAGGLLMAIPAGMLLTNVLIGRCVPEHRRARLVMPLTLLTGAPLIGFMLAPPLPVAAALLLLAGLGTGYTLGLQQPFLYAVPDDHRGQAFALNSTGMMGGQGLTPPLAGAMATAAGVGPAMAVTGVAAVLVALALRPARHVGPPTTRPEVGAATARPDAHTPGSGTAAQG